jgi:UTP--glucose-1-phosphate uridylyltransferase
MDFTLPKKEELYKQALAKLKRRHPRQEIGKVFSLLFNQYLDGNMGYIPWDSIAPLGENDAVEIDSLSDFKELGTQQAHRVAYLKLNGGLGTTMGCKGAKSSIIVHNHHTFLDIVKDHLKDVRKKYQAPFPLILMNSFNTTDQTNDIMDDFPYIELLQHEFPRINATTKEPFISTQNPQSEWNPPGHGDVLLSLITSNLAKNLIQDGIDYIFISNIDNLGPDFSPEILGYMIKNNLDFMIETTPKTQADVKGGTIVNAKGKLSLLERPQVAPQYRPNFDDLSTFKVFNTNNIWLNLRALITYFDTHKTLDLPLIVNPKIVEDIDIVQLETAIGSAIRLFEKTKTVVVHRNRFLPVKTTADLLVITSDIVQKTSDNTLRFNADLPQLSYPSISLDKPLQTMEGFAKCFTVIPSLKEVKSLRIEGPFIFKNNVILSGDVVLINTTAHPYILENQHIIHTTLNIE